MQARAPWYKAFHALFIAMPIAMICFFSDESDRAAVFLLSIIRLSDPTPINEAFRLAAARWPNLNNIIRIL